MKNQPYTKKTDYYTTAVLLPSISYKTTIYSHSQGWKAISAMYIGAAYVKTESNRLNFLRQNQTQLCAERYQDLMDQLQSRAAATNLPLGKVVILPATF